jgi:hypothetical protein
VICFPKEKAISIPALLFFVRKIKSEGKKEKKGFEIVFCDKEKFFYI